MIQIIYHIGFHSMLNKDNGLCIRKAPKKVHYDSLIQIEMKQ